MKRRRLRERGGAAGAPEYLSGLHAVGEALRARRRPLHRLLVRLGPLRPELEPLVALAREAGVRVEQADLDALSECADLGPGNWQGVALEAGPLPQLRSGRELAATITAGHRRVVALDGVEDPQNVGAIVRVAEAAGATGLLLTQRRAPPLSPALARASAGAIEWLPVARVPNLIRALAELRDRGFWLLGADPEAERSLFEMPDSLLQADLVVVLGAEGRGLRRGVREALDHPVRIPMRGSVASLNVASAAAVILFELLRRGD